MTPRTEFATASSGAMLFSHGLRWDAFLPIEETIAFVTPPAVNSREVDWERVVEVPATGRVFSDESSSVIGYVGPSNIATDLAILERRLEDALPGVVWTLGVRPTQENGRDYLDANVRIRGDSVAEERISEVYEKALDVGFEVQSQSASPWLRITVSVR